MSDFKQSQQMIDLIRQGAFCVSDGIVTLANAEAQNRQITVGTTLSSLLTDHEEAYRGFQSGILYLTLSVAGTPYHATVTEIEEGHLFVLDSYHSTEALQALSLASQHLRQQMATVMAAAQENDSDSKLMKGLYRMQRMLCNMSDISAIRNKPAPAYMMELGSAVYEITEKASTLLAEAGIRVEYTGSNEPIHTAADYELLERALYNLLSNAAKHCEKGSVLKIQLSRKNRVATITVEDDCCGIDSSLYSTLFTSYLREPSLIDRQQGIGLGMALVQAVAAHHGGTVLVMRTKTGGTKVALSIAITELDETIVRSPRKFLIDYAGELDHGLLELSDVLPAKLYNM